MKKILAILLAGAMIAAAGCSGGEESSTQDSSVSVEESREEASHEEVSQSEESSVTDESSQEEAQTESMSMENYLLSEGVLEGERTEMAASIVGAETGFKYGTAEIYQYDPESDAYKALEAGEGVTVEGFNMTMQPEAVNAGYALFASASGEVSQELIDAFNAYGK